MDIKGRILQSVHSRRDGLLPRSDASPFGSPNPVSAALHSLVESGLVARLDRGIYVMTTAKYVRDLAQKEGVHFHPIYADHWANAVTNLAGDDVKSDSTDDLLVALTRAGKITPKVMVELVIQHHRDLSIERSRTIKERRHAD